MTIAYRTEKQNSEKMKFFRTLSEVRAWVRTHKTAHITSARWQVFELMREAVQS